MTGPSLRAPADLRADTHIDLALFVDRTEAEGPGQRAALWVQGCPLRCPGCCNPEMLRFRTVDGEGEGRARLVAVSELLERLRGLDVEGVSLLGGEPTAHARALRHLARGAQAQGKSVMVFSGFTREELEQRRDPHVDDLLAHTDLLVDGRYDEQRRTTARRYIGSDNQVLHFLTDRYRPDDPRFAAPNTLELRLRGGVLTVNGFPIEGAARLWPRTR